MATIKEIAERCGVSKPTVRNNLTKLELWDAHVQDVDGVMVVDEAATAAVCDAILRRKRSQEMGPATDDEANASSMEQLADFETLQRAYAAHIADLQDQVRDLRLQLDGARDELRDAHRAEVDHARALPEAREEARERGAQEERERIRSLGPLARLLGRF